jgi:hypothetical protein
VLEKRRIKNASASDRTFGERDTAKRLGMPVPVLHYLRRVGHFEVRHATTGVGVFHESDIITFEEKLAALARQSSVKSKEPFSLGQAMHLKLKFNDGKGELVAAIFDGTLSIVGIHEPGFKGLLLDRREVEEFIAKARAKAFGGTLTPTEVSQKLYCDPLIVPTLFDAGYLEGYRHAAGLRITSVSVQRFGDEFVSVAYLAKERGSKSRWLMPRITGAGIKMIRFERGYGKASQPFVRVDELAKLLKAEEN